MKGGLYDNLQVLMLGSVLMMLFAASFFDVNASTNDTSAVTIAKAGDLGNGHFMNNIMKEHWGSLNYLTRVSQETSQGKEY